MIEFILLIQMILTLVIVFLMLYMLLTRNNKKNTEPVKYSEEEYKTLEQYLNLLNYEGDPYDKEKSE